MSVGKPGRAAEECVIALFRDEFDYRYPGDWTDRAGNSNVEDAFHNTRYKLDKHLRCLVATCIPANSAKRSQMIQKIVPSRKFLPRYWKSAGDP